MRLELSRSAQKDLDQLPDQIVLRIRSKVKKLVNTPYGLDSKKLRGDGGYRIRIGDYRVVYTVDKKSKVISIIKIRHRREVYLQEIDI